MNLFGIVIVVVNALIWSLISYTFGNYRGFRQGINRAKEIFRNELRSVDD